MNRAQRRDAALAVLRMHQKTGGIAEADVPTFEMLIRRCRSTEEYAQVVAAMNHYLDEMKTATDCHARLLRGDDPLGLDDDAEDSDLHT